MVRGWKFGIKKVEVLYYRSSEHKGADQLRDNSSSASLFSHMQKSGFLMSTCHCGQSSRQFWLIHSSTFSEPDIHLTVERETVNIAQVQSDLNELTAKYAGMHQYFWWKTLKIR